MQSLWDYDEKELQKTEEGRIFMLERMINYGPGRNHKIKLELVKKYWDRLNLEELASRFFELAIWNKSPSLPTNKRSFWTK